MQQQESQQRAAPQELRDPFSDLKAAFEPPKEKLKTFNLKQIVTRNGTVLMNMLERLLETTEIDARDVETDQTLLNDLMSSVRRGESSSATLVNYKKGGVRFVNQVQVMPVYNEEDELDSFMAMLHDVDSV